MELNQKYKDKWKNVIEKHFEMPDEARVVALRSCIELGSIEVAKHFVEAGKKYQIFTGGQDDPLIQTLISKIKEKPTSKADWENLIKDHFELSVEVRAKALDICNQAGVSPMAI